MKTTFKTTWRKLMNSNVKKQNTLVRRKEKLEKELDKLREENMKMFCTQYD